jgi:hypothetical protein
MKGHTAMTVIEFDPEKTTARIPIRPPAAEQPEEDGPDDYVGRHRAPSDGAAFFGLIAAIPALGFLLGLNAVGVW